MGAIKKTLATVAVTVALLGGGLAAAGPAAAQNWQGPIDSWGTTTPKEGRRICETSGRLGVGLGSFKEFRCIHDGNFTTHLYVRY